MRDDGPEERTAGWMRAPHLKIVTDSRTVKQVYLENVLRLWLEVVGLELKDMTLELAPRR